MLPILLFLLPLLVMAVWLGTVGQNPRYGQAGRGYRAALAEIAGKATPADGVVTVTPFHYQIPMNWYGGVYPAHRAGRWTTVGGGLPFYGYATDSADHPETVQVLARALRTHPQLWYVTGGLPPADPSNTVERWLAEHAFKAEDRWFDDFRLVRYGTPATLGDAPFRPVDVLLADAKSRVHLTGVRTPEYARPGVVLPVEIGYRLEQPAESPLRWFVQLLGADGAPVALLDTAPQDGYVPFPDLPAGVELRERAGLVLPPDLPTGRYRLIAGLYDPEQDGAPRLRTTNGEDTVELAPIRLP